MGGESAFFFGAGNALGFLVWVLAAFSALIVTWALIRTLMDIVLMGPLAYLRRATRIEPETWTLFAALLLVVLAVMVAFVFPTGLSAIGL